MSMEAVMKSQPMARDGELGGVQRELQGLQETSKKEVEGVGAAIVPNKVLGNLISIQMVHD